MPEINISVLDIAIVGIYLVLIVWWGIRNGKSSDSKSYFLAGRSMSWWVVGLSLFAASISSNTLVGQSGDAYHTGIAVFNYNLTGVVVMVFFAMFLLPLYIRSGIFTIPEFLEKRFDKRSRYYFSALNIVGNTFLDAASVLYAGALIVKMAMPEADIRLVVLIFAAITASYTIPGGLSSAIKTELIQAVILIVGSVLLTVLCIREGGWDHIASLLASDDTAMKLVRPLDDPATPWLGLIVGMPILGIYFWANNQTLVQRVLSARSVDEGRKGVLLNGGITLLTLLIIAIPGVMAQYLFPGLEKPDMVYPAMIMGLMPTALLGFMFAVLLAALTSTLSAIMNSTATLFTMDFYLKFNPEADTRKQVRVGKLASLAVVVIAVLWAPRIGEFGSLLKYYQQMLSYIAPPIVAAFIMGIFVKRVNARGVFWGLMAGLALAVVMLFFRKAVFGDTHFLLTVPFLFVLSAVIMYAVSLTAPAPDEEKLRDVVFTRSAFRAETLQLREVRWWSNYRVWSWVLLACCAGLLLAFS